VLDVRRVLGMRAVAGRDRVLHCLLPESLPRPARRHAGGAP